MATNLVSVIMQSLSPEVMGKLASSLGLEQPVAQKGITAAIPGILARLADTASGYDGVQKLSRAISQVDKLAGSSGDVVKGMLDSSKNVLGSGWNIGSSVLGGSALETLSSMVARYAGFDLGSAKKLLSFLVPVVLGFLKREQARHNLNNFGLAKLLAGQKSDIERAMPAGFVPDIEPRPPVRQDTGGATPSSESASAGKSVRQDRARWLFPALLIVAAAVYFLQKPEETKTAQEINQSTTTVAQQAPAKETAQIGAASTAKETAPVTAATLENDIETNIERLRVALPKVSDPASAQAAVSEIRDVSNRLAQLKSAAEQLSAEARKSVSDAVSARMSELNKLLDRIMKEINYLSGEAKPAIDTLKTKLADLSKA